MLKTLIYLAIKRALQGRGYFMVHASAAGRDGKAVLLFGASGFGKSITAITLCRNEGFGFLSNGSALVTLDAHGRPVVAGTLKAGLKLRYSSLRRSFPDLAERFFQKPGVSAAGFDVKRHVRPEELGLPVAPFPQPVAAFHKIRLEEGAVRAAPLNPYRTRLELYEDLARHVRAAACLLAFGQDYRMSVRVPSLDSPEIHARRTAVIEGLVSQALGESIYGQPAPCASYVAARLSTNQEAG